MTEEISFGLELMFAGMGIVYLFLTMLVMIINVMSNVVQRFFPEVLVTPTYHKTSSQLDKNVVAAISAAVHQHRNKHQ